MLYNLKWLNDGEQFPPQCESIRLERYRYYKELFDLNMFKDFETMSLRLIGNFDEFFNMPVLLAYQRLQTIKLCDMVLGAAPSITITKRDNMTDKVSQLRDTVDFDAKVQQLLIDYSRYGTAVARLFNDDVVEDGVDQGNFIAWEPKEWFPILRNDGTKRIKEHVLAWRVNFGTPTSPNWYLEVQRHPVEGGHYWKERYSMDSSGCYITKKISTRKVETAGAPCMIQYIPNMPSSSNIYGTSDYRVINDLIRKAVERMKQILHILNKHADPSMTGPVSMLQPNKDTGELEFRTSEFYAVSPGEEHPNYMTWDGQLGSAFKALEVLFNQIYIFSEMGEAFLGNSQGTGQAVSGTALRYKMVSPLEKARRVQNAFTLPLKKLISGLLYISEGEKIPYTDINITWEDSLPKDPREIAELTRLQTGMPQVIPLKHALMENYGLSEVDAQHYVEEIYADREHIASISQQQQQSGQGSEGDGNARPGDANNPAAPPNPNQKGSPNDPSKTGTKNVKHRKEDAE